MATRRGFLASLLAIGALPSLSWADAGNPAFVAAAQEPDGSFALFGLSAAGSPCFRVALPARGHAATAHPTHPEVVAFARRPGTYALVINCATGALVQSLTAPAGREFNGHGAFSLDGDTLYTSEVEAETGQGRIGLWSREAGYARIGEIASGGIGPHEIRRLPASETLVVANGGIQTGPGDREKLNLETMQPNLTYLDPDGTILQSLSLPPEAHQASIRHLALTPMGQVAFAMQWEGDVSRAPALLGLHRLGEASATLALAPREDHAAMQGYAGSVAIFDEGRFAAISSPKGGRVQVFSTLGDYAYTIERADVCGLAALGAALVLTDGLGTFVSTRAGQPTGHTRADLAWDNHLIAV
jgi:uncharacterized protein